MLQWSFFTSFNCSPARMQNQHACNQHACWLHACNQHAMQGVLCWYRNQFSLRIVEQLLNNQSFLCAMFALVRGIPLPHSIIQKTNPSKLRKLLKKQFRVYEKDVWWALWFLCLSNCQPNRRSKLVKLMDFLVWEIDEGGYQMILYFYFCRFLFCFWWLIVVTFHNLIYI